MRDGHLKSSTLNSIRKMRPFIIYFVSSRYRRWVSLEVSSTSTLHRGIIWNINCSNNLYQSQPTPPYLLLYHKIPHTIPGTVTSVRPLRCQIASKVPQCPHLCFTSLNAVTMYGIHPRQRITQNRAAAALQFHGGVISTISFYLRFTIPKVKREKQKLTWCNFH